MSVELNEAYYMEALADTAERIRQRIHKSGADLKAALVLEGVIDEIAELWAGSVDTRPDLAVLKRARDRGLVEFEDSLAADIAENGKPNDKLSLLERRFPDKYGRKQPEVSVPTTINVVLPDKLQEWSK